MAVVSGWVLKKWTLEPIAGAVVELDGYAVSTAGDGSFSLDVPPGGYMLRATYRNYEPFNAKVTAPSEGLRIELQPTVVAL